jgi:gliding motility-associated-like protein
MNSIRNRRNTRYALRRILILLLCISSINNTLIAQTAYEPPSLNCVRNISSAPSGTELNWSLPGSVNPCFTGYEIYASTGNTNGPYNLVATVTNPLQSSIQINPPTVPLYTGAASSITYFYMINRGSCINPLPTANITSDTLDNVKPQPYVVINSASVINNQVHLSWYPSPSPEVIAYLILSSRDGFNSFDTVFGRLNNTYIDTIGDPSFSPIRYKIRALEYCESPLGLQGTATPDTADHTTVFLRNISPFEDIDSCNRTVSIRWDPYDAGSAQVLAYEIQRSVNGSPFITDATLPPPGSAPPFLFTLQNIPYRDTVTVRVVAQLPNGAISYSNARRFSANAIQTPVNDYIRNITVENGIIYIEYRKDTLASPDTIRILNRSLDGIVFQPLIKNPDFRDRYKYIFSDENLAVNDNVYFYRLNLRDLCFNEHLSDTAATLRIGIKKRSNNRADILWSGFEIANITFNYFRLEKITGTDTVTIGTFNRTDDYYLDNQLFDFSLDSVQGICYRITAVFTNNNDPAPREILESHSNIICVEPEPIAFVPQAFLPDGVNNTFKPFLLYSKRDNYDFRIYDRWYQIVFSTQNVDERWDGSIDGKRAPADGYIYIVKFTGKNNREYTQTGTVMLIR